MLLASLRAASLVVEKFARRDANRVSHERKSSEGSRGTGHDTSAWVDQRAPVLDFGPQSMVSLYLKANGGSSHHARTTRDDDRRQPVTGGTRSS